jgi:predicted RNA-binding protein with TRAM domain
MTKRRFFLDGKPDMHVDHFVVLAEGKLVDLAPKAPVEEGAEIQLELVEVDRHDGGAAVGKVEGFDVCVAEAASLVGKRVKVRVERVLDGVAYATLVRHLKKVSEPLTAEAEAEKPTRKPPARKDAESQAGTIETDGDEFDDDEVEETDDDEVEAEDAEAEDAEDAEEPQAEEPEVAAPVDGAPATPAKKKTRRGSRGGKNRKKPAGAAAAAKPADVPEAEALEGEREMPAPRLSPAEMKVTIHLPSDDLGREDETTAEVEAGATVGTPSENGAPSAAKKKTRRGSRGGKNRRKRTAAAAASNGAELTETVATEPTAVEPEPVEEPSTNGAPEEDWGYVPMSEWVDELDK